MIRRTTHTLQHRATPGRRRAAFTLAEFTLSMAITSILLMAIGSSIVLASHAIPDGSETTASTIASSRAIDLLVEEVRYAVAISENTATSLEFAVADRDGDLSYEWIRYAWSGVADDPLTRQYNGGEPVSVVHEVSSFLLTYETIAYQMLSPPVVSAEMVLASHIATNPTDYGISSTTWLSQYIVPAALPAETVSWSVSRVQIKAASSGAAKGFTSVQLRRPLAGRRDPDIAVLDEYSIYEFDLDTTLLWTTAPIRASGLAPDEGLCIVLQWTSDPTSLTTSYDSDGGADHYYSSDGGVSWISWPGTALEYSAHGTYTMPGVAIDTNALQRVKIELVSGRDRQFVIHASADTLNQPEVATP